MRKQGPVGGGGARATAGAAPVTAAGLAPDAEKRRELLKKIRKIEIVTTKKVNDQLAGAYHSVFKGRGMSFDEVRPYQPGDEIRFIDWNVSARSTEVFVKRFVEERELTVMLLVDVSASLAFGTNAQEKREVAAELAALLAFSAVKNGDRVGLVLFSDEVEHYVPPKKGRKHVLRLISEILSYQAKGRGTSVSEALTYLQRVASRKTIAFLLSDFQTPPSAFDKPLRIVARRHDLVPILIRDAMEAELPRLGLVLVEDLETGGTTWLDTSSKSVRRAYAERAQRERQALVQGFRRLKLDHIQVETGGSYFGAIRQFFELRARRH
ncbi:MAG: DUF58 domain-containing protein [Deltaproteobacteria bacterium]|nr:DUF58 domain-containing protein [Deltaproteobacteria bacterium]